jgi:hypothetical protein
VELLPVPTLFAKLIVLRRLDARRQRDQFVSLVLAARGKDEAIQERVTGLSEAAGDVDHSGDVDALFGALGGS